MKNQYTADEKFIIGIRNFMRDAVKKGETDLSITATIAHDLAEWTHNREKDWWSPRTARFQPKDYARFRLWTYDLIHDGEGLSVNDRHKQEAIHIPTKLLEQGADKELIMFLKFNGPVSKPTKYSLWDIDGEADSTLYFNYMGNPAFELERESD